MRSLVLFSLFIIASNAMASDEEIRENGSPASKCFLFCFGKGPDGLVDLKTEIRLSYLEKHMPLVDDRKGAVPEALLWPSREFVPTTTVIAVSNGKRVVRVDYGRKPLDYPDAPEHFHCVMIMLETGEDWFRPFFVAEPELFNGRIIHSKEVAFAYTASLDYSGTGGFRSHYMFDLTGDLPKFVRELHTGRIREDQFKSEDAYLKALKEMENAAAFMTKGMKQ